MPQPTTQFDQLYESLKKQPMLDEPFSASKLKKKKKLVDGEEDSQSDGEGLLAKVVNS